MTHHSHNSISTNGNRPRSNSRDADREHMVRQQIAGRDVRNPRVIDAMRNVPRHWFVPDDSQASAYDDRPLSIGFGQTISQPYIVAHMTEMIDVQPGQRVLEIGTGSGYQTAILSELTDEVYSIEIVEPLGRRAAQVFRDRGYANIRTRIGDGYRGWPEAAPFDAIIVTCAPEAVPEPLVEQLAIGGRLCIPVGGDDGAGQKLIILTKRDDGTIEREAKTPVRFVPMTGEAQHRP